MGLFDLFSGESGRNASIQSQMGLGAAQNQITGQLQGAANQGIGAIQGGSQAAQGTLGQYAPLALGELQGGTGQARADLTGGMNAGLGSLNMGLQGGLAALNAGTQYGRTALNQGIAGYNPYTQAGAGSVGMQTNALGLGGPEGNAAARAAFQAGPGYEWQRDQAIDAAARKAGALGIAGSGNTLTGLSTLGSNLANQEYGSWLDRLQGLTNTGLAGAQGQAGQYANLANLEAQGGRDVAGAYGQYGANAANLQAQQSRALADAARGYGTSAANLYSGLGTGIAGLQSGAGTQEANVYQNLGNQLASTGTQFAQGMNQAANQGMLAGQNANMNQLNALIAGGQIAAQLAGGSKGSGGSGLDPSKLLSLFSGGGAPA